MSSGNTISGIYNYCDRWCERCRFTSRCAIYADVNDLSPEEKDVTSRTFWNRLSENFKEAIELLHQAAAAQGVDLANIPSEELEKIQEKQQAVDEQIENHTLTIISLDYAKSASHWLRTCDIPRNLIDERSQQLSLGLIRREEINKLAGNINGYLEIISRYTHFIHVTLMRAISGKISSAGLGEENDFQRDSDGSAKIALIATDKSSQAWIRLYDLMPEVEDDALNMLSLLQQIRILAETEFPNARKFIRPGFDE